MFRAWIVALVLVAGVPVAEKAKVVAGLQAWLDGTSTLEMRFRQSLVSGALGTTATESGRLYLERPGKVRWDYLDPEKKIALLLGDRTALYIVEERQMTRGRLSGEQGLFPRLLAGRDRIDDLFSADLVATPSTGGRGSYSLRLVPKGDPGATAAVTLTLRMPAFSIEAAELLDETGNRTTYAFSDMRRNRGLPEGLFAFEPPPGTEVVDER
jgi:outer membrane lipoprotein carrier protein